MTKKGKPKSGRTGEPRAAASTKTLNSRPEKSISKIKQGAVHLNRMLRIVHDVTAVVRAKLALRHRFSKRL